MDAITAVKSWSFMPFGVQLQKKNPWYPQESCGDSVHQASALSLGESTVSKYGINYPIRTGMEPSEPSDFAENVIYLPVQGGVIGQIEELYLSKGVCAQSVGPFGGPSFLKALYRPLNSYGTGIGVRSVAKVTFPYDPESTDEHKGSYICLAEKSGVSLYAEGSSESHVASITEFNIDSIWPCAYGLLFIPAKLTEVETSDEKGLYILSNPIKQVSQVWLKDGMEYQVYDNTNERLLLIEKDLCVFWSLKNDRFIFRRLFKLSKEEFQDTVSSTFFDDSNTSSVAVNSPIASSSPVAGPSSTCKRCDQPSTSRRFHDSPGNASPYFSPCGKSSRSMSMKANREGTTDQFWPAFDFSESSSPGLTYGFYPPHVCVYDSVEYAFNTLFPIILKANVKWRQPRKVHLFSNDNLEFNRVAFLYLIKHQLYICGVELSTATELCHYCLRDVQDFACPVGELKFPFVVTLTTSKQLKIGWFNKESFKMVCSAVIEHNIQYPIAGLHAVFFADTILCELEGDKFKRGCITLKNYMTNGLIKCCVDEFQKKLPSVSLAQIVAGYMFEDEYSSCFEKQWQDFINAVKWVLTLQETESSRLSLVTIMHECIEILTENFKLKALCTNYVKYLKEFPSVFHKKDIAKIKRRNISFYKIFGSLLFRCYPKESSYFNLLPEVMQLLLDKPDSLANMERLANMIGEEGIFFVPVLRILIEDVFNRNSKEAEFHWPENVLRAMGRYDYLSGLPLESVSLADLFQLNLTDTEEALKHERCLEDYDWADHVMKLNVFSDDRRVDEVCRLLGSTIPLVIDVEQRAEMSDHEFVEEQEKNLLQQIQVTFAAPVGRAAFTLRSEEKTFANLTSTISIPRMCVSGKCALKNTSIELNETDLPPTYANWPNFHNSVAAAMSVRFIDKPADAWFAYSKAKTHDGPDQAGMVLGFGLNGILSSMPATLRHEYFARENSFTSMSMLLGLCADLAGTGDVPTWKVVSLHIGAMLPSCTTELEIPRLATLVAPVSLGLLFLGTHNRHIAKVLLGEISKRYNILSGFTSTGVNSNAAANVNTTEGFGVVADREAHSLCAGFGLGFVNLGKGRTNPGCTDEDGIDGILRRFVVGGPKPSNFTTEEEDFYNQYGQNMPSLWEEYRCCHIEEGDNVNVDVTTPSAIIAVGLIYLRSGNEAVLKWLSPPTSLHMLDGVRPDLLMLRGLASVLVLETIPSPLNVSSLEKLLIPRALQETALRQPDSISKLDHESINQSWTSIVCGYCLGLGIRYAGTSDHFVKKILWHYTEKLLDITNQDSKLAEYFPKNFLESSISTLLMALSLVLAGTGDIPVLRLCRFMQSKVAATPITSSSTTYGLEMCISMATGILFLGGGRYSLCNDDKSIAVLLASVFPKWPVNATDNRYHLQALRHLYALAAQPRLILPKPMPRGSTLSFTIEYLDGQEHTLSAPVLLPPFHLIQKISIQDRKHAAVSFHLPRDLPYLHRIVENGGVLNLIKRPMKYLDYNFFEVAVQHETEDEDDTCPVKEDDPALSLFEQIEIRDQNTITRLAERHGLSRIIPSIMELKHGNPADEDWLWQIRILIWWVGSKDGETPSTLPMEILAMLRSKIRDDGDLFVPIPITKL